MKTYTRLANGFKDLTGKRFSRLIVLHRGPNELSGKKFKAQWFCKCDCGYINLVRTSALTTGNTKSCGCLTLDATRLAKTTHGHSVGGRTTSEFNIWRSMIQRCHNKRCHNYADYGGRGITVCIEWRVSFASFFYDMGKRPPGLTIDRIENDKGYFPSNCRWATRKQQANNRRHRKIQR